MSRPERHSEKVKYETALAKVRRRGWWAGSVARQMIASSPLLSSRMSAREACWMSSCTEAFWFLPACSARWPQTSLAVVPRLKLWISQEGLVATEITLPLLPAIMTGHVCELTAIFTVRGLSAKMKQYNRMTVRNYTLGLIFVLAGGGYRQHLQCVLSRHGLFQAWNKSSRKKWQVSAISSAMWKYVG